MTFVTSGMSLAGSRHSNNENILKIRLGHYIVNNDTLICAGGCLTTELDKSPTQDFLLVGRFPHE